MKELSVGALLASQIAAIGVRTTKHEYMEKEHLLIGLCSLEKTYMLAEKFALNPDEWQTVLSEHKVIEGVLGKFKMSTIQLRRQVRSKLGRIPSRATKRVIHRSEACKQVFAHAGKLATPTEHVSCLHLLAALLEEPGEIINFVFQEIGVVPMDVRQHILIMISPQQGLYNRQLMWDNSITT